MLNIIQLQDRLKGLPDSALQAAATMPGEHQILAMAEMAERQRIRGAYANSQQQAQPTVMDRLTAGGEIPEVRNQRPDMGALAAASNQGAMQPAIGMAQGGAVYPSHMQAAGPVEPLGQAGEKITVTADMLKSPEVKQLQLDPYSDAAMIEGYGAYKDSGGLSGFARRNLADAQDAYMQSIRENMQANPYTAMLAAQEQDRARNEQLAKRDRWLALAQAGLGMAAGNSPNFLTNVAAGGQAGLAALRQGNTEAERRQAMLQQRTDMLQAAGSTIEGNNAQAMRAGFGNSFNAETQLGNTTLQGSLSAFANQKTREHQSDEASKERGFRAAEGAADRAARLKIAQINEAGATARANAQLEAEKNRLTEARQETWARLYGSVIESVTNSFFKEGETPSPAAQAQASRTYMARALPLARQYGIPAEFVAANNPFALQQNPTGSEQSGKAAPPRGPTQPQ